MKFLKILGYGISVWILMFVIISAFIAFGVQNNIWVKIIGTIIGGVIAFALAGRVKLKNSGAALSVGLIWVISGLILDYLVTRHFNAGIFQMWQLWAGYFLVFIAPVFRVRKEKPVSFGGLV